MIRGIFYSQFDNILGPKIVHQTPDGLISPEVFDCISDYIITKPSLCDRLTCVRVQNNWIMGVPMCLAHTKYQRNALLFNMGFVVSAEDPLIPIYRQSLEQSLFKLANYLTNFERESEYLIRQTNNSIQPKPLRWRLTHSRPSADISQNYAIFDSGQIPGMEKARSLLVVMRELLHNLNNELSASVPVDDVNAIFLQLTPTRPVLDPTLPQPYHVPIPIADLSEMFSTFSASAPPTVWGYSHQSSNPASTIAIEGVSGWDLALQTIVPYIDGVNYVKKIASDADMDLDVVTKALQHLLYYQCIRLTDVFQYGNIYAIQQTVRRLYSDKALQRACAVAVADDPTRPLPSPHVLFQLYCQLQPGVEVCDFVKAYEMRNYNIDIRRLISFGLVNNLIRRMHVYPLSSRPPTAQTENSTPQLAVSASQLVDGKHHFDEIAVQFGSPYSELWEQFDRVVYR